MFTKDISGLILLVKTSTTDVERNFFQSIYNLALVDNSTRSIGRLRKQALLQFFTGTSSSLVVFPPANW